jgi:putative resolvase
MPKVSIQDASDLLGVHLDTLRRWEEEGKIVAERTSGGHRRYNVSKLLGTAELKKARKRGQRAAMYPYK